MGVCEGGRLGTLNTPTANVKFNFWFVLRECCLRFPGKRPKRHEAKE